MIIKKGFGMGFLENFFISLWQLSAAMSFYILFGLLIAGILHEIIPSNFIQRHLGKSTVLSVIKSTLFGIPLPVCSCGVIPLAAALKKEGASKGSVLSFLISTPITGIDSILATFGIFGLAFTVYRVVSSVIIALIAGILENIFDKEKEVKKFKINPFSPINSAQNISFVKTSLKKEAKRRRFSFKNALRYGFVTLMKDIAKPLFWGLLIGALISTAIPENLGEVLSSHLWIGYLASILIALPMYVCATASLPIAASLVLNGVSLGAAFVFLTAGPATNTVTMGVVKNMLGKRALILYLLTISGGSLLFGVGLDLLFGSIEAKRIVKIKESVGLVESVSSIILYILIFYFLLKPLLKKEKKSCCA